MKTRNYTPFPTIHFQSIDLENRQFGVSVVQGTFSIRADEPLRPNSDQLDLIMKDEYGGEIGESSLVAAGGLAPYKSSTDVLIDAQAHAPNGKAARDWHVSAEIGPLNKELLVTGPRWWQRQRSDWVLTESLAAETVPLTYEHAFGGRWSDGRPGGKAKLRSGADYVEQFDGNPIGCGFVPQQIPTDVELVQMPQILHPADDNPAFGKTLSVEGFGPIPGDWSVRSQHAGTFDDAWRLTRWPALPEDFKYRFYNCAHPDLIADGFLKGDEAVRLTNLTPSGELCFELPSFSVAQLVRFEDGEIAPIPMMLDTVDIRVPGNQAILTWRGVFPVARPIRVLEIRMDVPQWAKTDAA